MKKLLIAIFLIIISSITAFSQSVDTSVFRFGFDNVAGFYTYIENKVSYYGKSAGTFKIPLWFINNGTIDTSIWNFYQDPVSGKYTYVMNKVEWYGLSALTVKANIINTANDVGGSSFNVDSLFKYLDTTQIAMYDKDGTFIGVMTFTGNVYMNRAYIDTLITHTIDSVGSTYWIGSGGDTVAYVDVTKDTIAFFKVLKFGNAVGSTLITSDSVTSPRIVISEGTAWYFNIGGIDYWFMDATGLFPALTETYHIGSSTYKVDSIRTNHLQLFEHLIGNTQIRDTNSFDNDATSDTVTVTGASVSDLYFIQTMGQVVAAEDFCVVEPTATGFIVRRSASGTANLRYAWWRIK
jgi:hypothetical protein